MTGLINLGQMPPPEPVAWDAGRAVGPIALCPQRAESARQQHRGSARRPQRRLRRGRAPVPAHLGGRDVHHTCRPPLLPQLPLLDLPLALPGAGARALSLGGQLLLALGGARCGGGLGPAAPGERRWRILAGGAAGQGGAGEADAVHGPAGGGRPAVGGQIAAVVQLRGGAAPRGTGLPPARCARSQRRLLRPHLLPLGFPFLQKVRGAAPGAAVAAGRHVPGGLDGESAPPAPLPPPAPRRLCCRPERRGPGGSGGRDGGGRDGGGERGSEHKHPGEKQKGGREPSRRTAHPRPAASPTPREAPGPGGRVSITTRPRTLGSHGSDRAARPRRGAPRSRGLPSPLSAGPPAGTRLLLRPPARPPAAATTAAQRRPSPRAIGCHAPDARAIPPPPACLPGEPRSRAAGRGERGRRSPPARRGRGSGAARRRRHQVSGTASRPPGRSGAAPSLRQLPPLSPSRRGHSRSQGGNCRDGLDNGVRAGRPRPGRCAQRPERSGRRPSALPWHLPRTRTRTWSSRRAAARAGEGEGRRDSSGAGMSGPGRRRPRPPSVSPAALTLGGRGLPEPRREGPEKAGWCHRTPPRGLRQTRPAPAAKPRPRGPDVRQVPGWALGRGGSGSAGRCQRATSPEPGARSPARCEGARGQRLPRLCGSPGQSAAGLVEVHSRGRKVGKDPVFSWRYKKPGFKGFPPVALQRLDRCLVYKSQQPSVGERDWVKC